MNVLVTGGGLEVPIDRVRKITNSSTGRFSAEITEAFLRRGAEVWHVHAEDALLPFHHRATFSLDCDDAPAEHERIESVRREFLRLEYRLHLQPVDGLDSYQRRLETLLTGQPMDMAILAMAVPDYEANMVEGKVSSNLAEWDLKLRPTPKVIRHVRDWASGVFLVGFKLLVAVPEAELIEVARRACDTNRADLTIANDLALKDGGRHTVHAVSDAGLIATLRSEDRATPLAETLVDVIVGQFTMRAAGETS